MASKYGEWDGRLISCTYDGAYETDLWKGILKGYDSFVNLVIQKCVKLVWLNGDASVRF